MAMVEFVLIVPVLILLVVGLVEVGRFTYYSIVVGNAARAGAQYGAQSLTTAIDSTGMATAATTDGQNNIHNITAQGNDVCTCWNGTTGTESPSPPTHAQCGLACATGRNVTYVQVNTSGTFNALLNWYQLPSTFTVSAQAIMRVRPQ